jgi:hypothetical protein
MSHSGYQNCQCCGDVMIVDDDRTPHLCADCIDSFCEMTADATGEVAYWECQQYNELATITYREGGREITAVVPPF